MPGSTGIEMGTSIVRESTLGQEPRGGDPRIMHTAMPKNHDIHGRYSKGSHTRHDPASGYVSSHCQSVSLWKNPCTLAAPYRVVPGYNYSAQVSNADEGTQQQHLYEPQHHQQLQHAGAQNHDSLQELGGQQPPQHHHQPMLLGDPMAQLAGQTHFRGGQHLTYGTPSQPRSSSLKRVRQHEELDMNLGLEDDGLESLGQQSMVGYGQPPPPQHHHHHHIPDSGRPSKMSRHGGAEEAMMSQGAPSVVGQPGMPSPAQKPRGPKLKFTPEDDQLLVDLKENKSLTWKQIAEFFPGRSSGTLQVRYCTKLKAKTTQWTDETVQKLRVALQDYEQEKWRIVAGKVGTGFTPAACREKAEEL
ncbi:hypothetical protein V491_05876 [Pseudogymnoascus sp. VKM F-3775]|nr:hypothetical protein V491_05876 [Pseudogymnoascus sp. VKM F-3775]